MNRVIHLKNIQKEAVEKFKSKEYDYGDGFSDYDLIGMLVRLSDNVKKCQNIKKQEIVLKNDKKLRKILIDMHNYAAMAIMSLDERNIDYSDYEEDEEDREDDEDYQESEEDSGDEDYQESEDESEELILQDNVPEYKHTSNSMLLKDWKIMGDSGQIYNRKQYYKENVLINTCSCESFKWSKENVCKHIKNTTKYKPIEINE